MSYNICLKIVMSYNKRFTNRATRSVLEIRNPQFCARPSQARAVRKRSGFVFPSTDRVTRLVNRYYRTKDKIWICHIVIWQVSGTKLRSKLWSLARFPPPPLSLFLLCHRNPRVRVKTKRFHDLAVILPSILFSCLESEILMTYVTRLKDRTAV